MATQAQLEQGYNDFVNAMVSGNFAQAANVAASLGFSPAETEAFIEANAPGLGFAAGTDIPSDVVASYFAPPATTPVVTGGQDTTRGNVATGDNVGNVTTNPIYDFNAVNLLNQLDAAMLQKDFTTASSLINQAAQIYGPDTYANVAQYLGITNQGAGSFTPQALQAASGTFVPKPPPLPTLAPPAAMTTQSNIDPLIAPYLQEALERSRSLFLGTQGPQMFPGQTYVSPSAQTELALTQMEQLAALSQPYYMQAQAGLTTGMEGLQQTAGGGFLQGSPYREQLIEAATRPLTQQFTEQVMPGIQSTFSQAGRLGSGAQAAVTGRATEGFTRALGDVTANIAAQDYARERAFQEQATRDVINAAGQYGSVFQSFLAPSQTLAQVGAQREAIAAQPLQEAMQRFEFAQQQPYRQLQGYLGSIYGSPLAGAGAVPETPQGNTALQDIGAFTNILGSLGKFGQTDLGKATFNFLGVPGISIS
jgi:hypothetical protein